MTSWHGNVFRYTLWWKSTSHRRGPVIWTFGVFVDVSLFKVLKCTNVSRALQKIISKFVYCKNRLLMRISSWNFVRVPKAMLWAHVQSFSLKFSLKMWFLTLYIFARLFWRAHKTLVKQPPGLLCGDFPSQRPVTQIFDAFVDLSLNKRLSRDAGDLRRHRTHYDVIVIECTVKSVI